MKVEDAAARAARATGEVATSEAATRWSRGATKAAIGADYLYPVFPTAIIRYGSRSQAAKTVVEGALAAVAGEDVRGLANAKLLDAMAARTYEGE